MGFRDAARHYTLAGTLHKVSCRKQVDKISRTKGTVPEVYRASRQNGAKAVHQKNKSWK
jgi:hypothetical protein